LTRRSIPRAGRSPPRYAVPSLAERLAPYKRPSRIVIAERVLPRLGSEKIDKRAVRDAYLAGL